MHPKRGYRIREGRIFPVLRCFSGGGACFLGIRQ